MIRIGNIGIKAGENPELIKKAAKRLRVSEKEILSLTVYSRSLDARKKNDIMYVYVLDVKVKGEDNVLKKVKDEKNISKATVFEYSLPVSLYNSPFRPVVVGFGPAGMFAALMLSEAGLKPVVLEQGEPVEERTMTVKRFLEGGGLNVLSNVQFGEGGAGAFSDGKLTSRSKDIRARKVLEEFIRFGAPEEILFAHNPHIGTDKLKNVIINIRRRIIDLGGEIRFKSKVTDIAVNNGKAEGVFVNKDYFIKSQHIVLALGHSARDTFEMLYEKGFALEQKAFAIGLRIEHPQEIINKAQYGEGYKERYKDALPPAEYKLTYSSESGRGVYTFCMCPGGYVINASSEEGGICTNGMSNYLRNGEHANSAVLVQILPSDFKDRNPLAGMYFQRDIEKKAFYAAGGDYSLCAQRLSDFISGNISVNIEKPEFPRVSFVDINEVLPKFICEAVKEAIPNMGHKLKGFAFEDALLIAPETRSSSPVRILRDNDTLESLKFKGIYPTGEGAGYAGGIMSSAIDGIKIAEKILENKTFL